MNEHDYHSQDDQYSRLEGMMIAHRKILADMIARLEPTVATELLEKLETRETFQDGQEDPGAVPTDGLGISLAISEETAKIISLARARSQETSADD